MPTINLPASLVAVFNCTHLKYELQGKVLLTSSTSLKFFF
jgi:hypothetical protein